MEKDGMEREMVHINGKLSILKIYMKMKMNILLVMIQNIMNYMVKK